MVKFLFLDGGGIPQFIAHLISLFDFKAKNVDPIISWSKADLLTENEQPSGRLCCVSADEVTCYSEDHFEAGDNS